MSRRLVVLLVAAGPACASGRRSSAMVIDAVSVIDVEARTELPDQMVLIDSGRIVSVRPASQVDPPPGATVIDGTGKYLIPGLWDMHVHLSQVGKGSLPVLLANGITGVRDMGGDFAVLSSWRRSIEADSLLGPRMVLPGPKLDGPPNNAAVDRLLLVTPDAGTRAVDSLAALGVDFIKVYEGLPREVFFAVARQARAKRLDLAGHVPRTVTPLEASDSGMKSIEHIGFIPPACLAMFDPGAIAAKVPIPPVCRGDGLDTVFVHFARNGTWLDPTVVSFLGFVRAADTSAEVQARMTKVSPDLLAWWRNQQSGLPKWPLATWQALVDHVIKLTGMMRQAQVPILAGSDLGNPYVLPGESLHEELGLLVRAGYTPIEALRTATVGAASYLGISDSVGTITPGKVADLVLLRANPLADIANTRTIERVIVRGKLLPREGGEAGRRGGGE
jgi:imidazolonepropionase-like amidohydrolase